MTVEHEITEDERIKPGSAWRWHHRRDMIEHPDFDPDDWREDAREVPTKDR